MTQTLEISRYNLPGTDGVCSIDEEKARAIGARILELGCDHAFYKDGHCATFEENAAFHAGTLLNAPRSPCDRYDRLAFVYDRGPVERAFEEHDADPMENDARALVDELVLKPLREQKRAKEEFERAAALRAAVEGFETTPAIRAWMLAKMGQHGFFRAPKRRDLSDFVESAKRTHDQWGKKRAPFKPDPSCPLRLKLKDGVSFGYSQEAYADHSTTLVPVTGEIPKDEATLSRCRANLADFFRRADTHTGWAGSGANWSAELVVTELGAFAVVFCRASISD